MNTSADNAAGHRVPPPVWLVPVAAIVPWVWTIGLVPVWMSLVSALSAIAAMALWMYVGRRPRAADDSTASAANSVQTFLHRWSGMAHQTHNNLHDVRQQIHGVMEQTEQAVLSLSGSFRNITAKTSEQMSHALNLLQSTHGIALNPDYATTTQSLSLPEYLRTSEELVQRLANEILRYSEMSLKLLLHENEMHVSDQRLDEALTDIQDLARKIEGAADGRADAVADIARLAKQAIDASADAQARARSVRDYRAGLYRSVAQIANDAKATAASAKGEMARVAGDMRKKNEEVAALVGRINTLGEEVRKDIYRVVVELQFQDITHQKLERVKTPLLNELGQGLRAIAQETHLLYEKLRRSVLDRAADGAANTATPPEAPADGDLKAGPAHHLQGAYQKPELGNKVELF